MRFGRSVGQGKSGGERDDGRGNPVFQNEWNRFAIPSDGENQMEVITLGVALEIVLIQ